MIMNDIDIEKIEDKRVVLLQSGGLDSCYLACLFNRYGFHIEHVFIDYGQNARVQELSSAERIVKEYGGNLHIVKLDMPWLKDVCLLNGGTVEDYSEREDVDYTMGAVQVGTYVPMRNHVFISIASSLAESLKIPYIASGLDGTQSRFGKPLGGTTDKHPNFVKKLEKSINESSVMHHLDKNDIQIITPVMGNAKETTISWGRFLGCDFSLSWTCYNETPDNKPCGTCCACVDRQSHFSALGLKDPLLKD